MFATTPTVGHKAVLQFLVQSSPLVVVAAEAGMDQKAKAGMVVAEAVAVEMMLRKLAGVVTRRPLLPRKATMAVQTPGRAVT